MVGGLKESAPPKVRQTEPDLWIYKGTESIGRKLREVVLSSSGQILCVSPFPVAPEILRLLFDALGRSRRVVRVVLNEANRPDLAELGSLLGRNMRVQFHFPSPVTPFETQVPTASRTRAFRDFACIASAFMLAILIACASDRFPSLVLPGSPEPFSIFSSFVMSADVGGVPTSIVKAFDFGSTSNVTGTFIPSKLFVFSLIALMISTMFRPRGPSAGPKGGPGVAFPPSTRTFSFSTIVRNLGKAAPESGPT